MKFIKELHNKRFKNNLKDFLEKKIIGMNRRKNKMPEAGDLTFILKATQNCHKKIEADISLSNGDVVLVLWY